MSISKPAYLTGVLTGVWFFYSLLKINATDEFQQNVNLLDESRIMQYRGEEEQEKKRSYHRETFRTYEKHGQCD